MSKPQEKRKSTTEIAEELILPILEELDIELWDVRFEKEGTQWYLRYFIEKDGGIGLTDCETVSRAVSEKLDQEDPIRHNYILEVGSPGLDRFLKKDEHYQAYIGEKIYVRLIRPVNHQRNYRGELISKEGPLVTMRLEDGTDLQFEVKEAAFVRLHIDF